MLLELIPHPKKFKKTSHPKKIQKKYLFRLPQEALKNTHKLLKGESPDDVFFGFFEYNSTFKADRKRNPTAFVSNMHVLYFKIKLGDVSHA